MKENEKISSISDASKPNAGRVYDYLLGGNTNFEIDRKAGDELIKIMPFIREIATLVRWFLGIGAKKGLELGFTQFLDFASGLPSVSHIHTIIPADMKQKVKIIYSDIDPITVQLGKDIIEDNPLMKYELCDIKTPEKLLESDAVKTLFGDNHKAAIGCNGICYFLTDDEIKHTINVLYDWAARDSILFFCDIDVESQSHSDSDIGKKGKEIYKNMNQPVYWRTKEKMAELIRPWKIMEPGFLDLEKWHNFPSDIMHKAVNLIGHGIGNYGGILIK